VIYCFVLLSLLSGCRCAPADTVQPVGPVLAHYSGWRGLLLAVGRGDLATIRVEARDLSPGAVAESADGAGALALDKVSASLGYLQAASSLDELGTGLGRAAQGCGACHQEMGVIPSVEPPEWSHEAALNGVVHGLVWGERPLFSERTSPAGKAVVNAYQHPVVVESDTGRVKLPGEPERLQSLLGACWGCHPPGLGEGGDPGDIPTKN
jgi:mono/diheme cytochrome c family protein